MGGINIHCPPFVGRDKSGTPFEAVLAEISEEAGQEVEHVVRGIDEALEIARDHILIDPADAATLIDPLRLWIERNPNDARPLFKECAEDLLAACRAAVSNGGPVALVW
jgi:hypothetical protein